VKETHINDETLTGFVKQSTQQREKGQTKREDPSLSQNCKNPKWVTKDK
jgi:hypothetical protein